MEHLDRTRGEKELAAVSLPDPYSAAAEDTQRHSGGRDTGERRRPNRIQVANPHLIPLLRSPIPAEAPDPDWKDSLRPARGIAFGLLLVAPFWVGAAGLLLWFWFHR